MSKLWKTAFPIGVALALVVVLAVVLIPTAEAHGSGPPQPPPCYGDCPTNQTFTASRYIYAEDFVEYSAWGPTHSGNCGSGDGENDGLCEDWWTSGNHHHHHRTILNAHACPAGYEYHERSGSSNDCRKLETFTVTFDYIKDVSDVSKCHRPTASSLSVPSWAQSDFNTQFPEHQSAPSGPQYCPYVPCSEQVAGTPPATEYGQWSGWAYNQTSGLWERTRTVTTYSAPMLDARDGSVCVPSTPTVTTETDTYVLCSQQVVGAVPETEYGQWSAWTYSQTTGNFERTRTVTTYSAPMVDALDGNTVCVESEPTVTTQTESQGLRTTFLYGYGTSPEEDPDCSGWWGILRLFRDDVMVDSDYQAELWSDPYALESVTPAFSVSDGGYTYSEAQTFTESQDCQEPHETGPWYDEEGCDGYEYGYYLDGERVQTGEGWWQDEFKAEEVWVTVVVPADEGEEYPQGTEFTIYIGEEEECLECSWTALYPMSIYIPANAPPTYWHGPFSFPACAVIHKDDQVASADRVTMVCSLCPDQIEGGFIFNAISKPYTGWLYEVECYGKGVTYVFADSYHQFEWNEDWVRKDEFNELGERCEDSPRVEGCSAWIHAEAGIPYYEPPDSQ